jgi:hypothetical protein
MQQKQADKPLGGRWKSLEKLRNADQLVAPLEPEHMFSSAFLLGSERTKDFSRSSIAASLSLNQFKECCACQT